MAGAGNWHAATMPAWELHVAEPAFGLKQVLVAQRDVLGRQVRGRRPEQLLPVEARLGGDLGQVEDQPPGRRLREPAAEAGVRH